MANEAIQNNSCCAVKILGGRSVAGLGGSRPPRPHATNKARQATEYSVKLQSYSKTVRQCGGGGQSMQRVRALNMALHDILLLGAVLGSTAFTIFLLSLPSRYQAHTSGPSSPEREGHPHDGSAESRDSQVVTSVQVLVLGDIGRSPRMQYHAISIAKNGGRVDLIGYQGQQHLPPVPRSQNLTISRINTTPEHYFGSSYLYRTYSASTAIVANRKQDVVFNSRAVKGAMANLEFMVDIRLSDKACEVDAGPGTSTA